MHSDTEFGLLNGKVSGRLQRQLAAALMPALPGTGSLR